MPSLIVVCGPQAVGKMTVAEKLRDKLKYNLMLNHDSIEVSDRIFGFSTPAQKDFNRLFRQNAFEVALKHNVDLIFTYVCAFEMEAEREYLTALSEQFISSGGNFYLVELYADIDTRLRRNETPHRMEKKPSKRDVKWSRAELIHTAEKHRLNSFEDEHWFSNHIKINNTELSPECVADIVIETFGMIPNDKDEKEYNYEKTILNSSKCK